MKNPIRSERPSQEPPGFNLRHYIEEERQFDWPVQPHIKLKLRLGPYVRTYFEERPLSPDQRITRIKKSDKSRLMASVQETKSLHWWLMSFGASVEVLAPKKLRQELARSLDKTARLYRKHRA